MSKNIEDLPTGSRLPNKLVTILLMALAASLVLTLWLTYVQYLNLTYQTGPLSRDAVRIERVVPTILETPDTSIVAIDDPANQVRCYVVENSSGRLAMACVDLRPIIEGN